MIQLKTNKIFKDLQKKAKKYKKNMGALIKECKKKLPLEIGRAIKSRYIVNNNEISYKIIKGNARKVYKVTGDQIDELIITYRSTRKALRVRNSTKTRAGVEIIKGQRKGFNLEKPRPYKIFIFNAKENLLKKTGGVYGIEQKNIKLLARKEKDTAGRWRMHVFRTLALSQMVKATKKSWETAFAGWLKRRFSHYFRK